MAEAEDLITDVARHATAYAQALWRRRRSADAAAPLRLDEVATRLDLLVTAVFGTSYPLRTAQPPSHPTLLDRLFGRRRHPWLRTAVPATDGATLWLPGDAGTPDPELAVERYRVAVLQQAMRAQRGSAEPLAQACDPVETALLLLIEAHACDAALLALVPGLRPALERQRRAALAARPPLAAFSGARRSLEALVRRVLDSSVVNSSALPLSAAPAASLAAARALAEELCPAGAGRRGTGIEPLLRDWWTGELRAPPASAAEIDAGAGEDQPGAPPRSARLPRRPEVRQAKPEEDEPSDPGVWMVQNEGSHQHAEDPLGMQRPLDRDEELGAEQFGDLLSELPEARLVSSPGRPPEVLLSDDPPPAAARRRPAATHAGNSFRYPEWDYRSQSYGALATVTEVLLDPGPQAWVESTLAAQRAALDRVRRQFEMLKAERVRLHRQLEGDELDLSAYVESFADFRAGQSQSPRIYTASRPARRSIAVSLLVDISGSTDGWVSANSRIIDVERQALLLVCLALQALGEPYAVNAFSGHGPAGVATYPLKRFGEHYHNDVALRIAALEPQHYTRLGAALRHVTADLMQQGAAHRLLLVLSDGKPHDFDHYDGRYGVEDVRQAVTEARLQQIHPFCLTIDRQAPTYLPHMFGTQGYGLLAEPAALPRLLLEWIRQLLTH